MGRRRKTHEEYLNDLELKGITFRVLDEYITAAVQIRHQCDNGHIWLVKPEHILYSNSKCPECYCISMTKTDEEYNTELLELNADLYPLEPYINSRTKILHECGYGHRYRVAPVNIIKTLKCKYCNWINNTSTCSTMVYLIKFTHILNDYYKIGITTKSIEHRFGKEFQEYNMELISGVVFDNDSDARDLERLILTKYKKYLYNIGILAKGNTEIFEIDDPLILNEILSLLDNHPKNKS